MRVVNDAALILVYHFASQAEEAERMLLHAVELGARQKDDPTLDDEARDRLLEAWGDAHQNLGLLNLVTLRRPEIARQWFQLCVEIGPRPRIDRSWVTDVALPQCAKALAGEPLDLAALDPRIWSAE